METTIAQGELLHILFARIIITRVIACENKKKQQFGDAMDAIDVCFAELSFSGGASWRQLRGAAWHASINAVSARPITMPSH